MFKVSKSHPTCIGIDPKNYMVTCVLYIVAITLIGRFISHRLQDDGKRFRSRYEDKAIICVLPFYLLLQLVICEYTLLMELRWQSEKPINGVKGIYWILLLNLGIYVVDYVFEPRMFRALILDHRQPAWYQFVTAAFCHSSGDHLFSNLFYINTVSVGASDAVYGLAAICLFVKMHSEWTHMLLVLILTYEFVSRMREELRGAAAVLDAIKKGDEQAPVISHISHVAGALTGVGLACLRAMVPVFVLNVSIEMQIRYISTYRSGLVIGGQLN
ncbi:rhomboid-like protein 11, chloroplastic isoform X3 [Papaver somniferum]|uniref:rhomboid-like protein 11, chloroplastic isoform X3 n=1 Tax=Papaver somniferum TaxID=3469 RepID=UPI000E6F6900|nr:rhomboid-like protein 11, chloroplastic isoform X3 [Papaver somniferum]